MIERRPWIHGIYVFCDISAAVKLKGGEVRVCCDDRTQGCSVNRGEPKIKGCEVFERRPWDCGIYVCHDIVAKWKTKGYEVWACCADRTQGCSVDICVIKNKGCEVVEQRPWDRGIYVCCDIFAVLKIKGGEVGIFCADST